MLDLTHQGCLYPYQEQSTGNMHCKVPRMINNHFYWTSEAPRAHQARCTLRYLSS
jgi:hypothetical protein